MRCALLDDEPGDERGDSLLDSDDSDAVRPCASLLLRTLVRRAGLLRVDDELERPLVGCAPTRTGLAETPRAELPGVPDRPLVLALIERVLLLALLGCERRPELLGISSGGNWCRAVPD